MQYISSTQNSGVQRGPINQRSTLRKLKCKKGEGTRLKLRSWSVEQLQLVSSPKLSSLWVTASLSHLLGRPEIPPLDACLQSVSPILLPHLSNLRQQLSWYLQPPPWDGRCQGSSRTAIIKPPSGHPEPVNLAPATTPALSAPTQSKCSSTAARLLNLQIFTDPNCVCQELWEGQDDTDHGPCPGLSARNT